MQELQLMLVGRIQLRIFGREAAALIATTRQARWRNNASSSVERNVKVYYAAPNAIGARHSHQARGGFPTRAGPHGHMEGMKETARIQNNANHGQMIPEGYLEYQLSKLVPEQVVLPEQIIATFFGTVRAQGTPTWVVHNVQRDVLGDKGRSSSGGTGIAGLDLRHHDRKARIISGAMRFVCWIRTHTFAEQTI
jgi:hypothetical protein